jgi:hypothetical protein
MRHLMAMGLAVCLATTFVAFQGVAVGERCRPEEYLSCHQ